MRTAVRKRLPFPLAAGCAAACFLLVTVASAGSPVAYTAYVANFGSGSLTPINTATNATSIPDRDQRPDGGRDHPERHDRTRRQLDAGHR